MRILFTRGNNPVSTIICALTKEPVSHVAIEIDGYVLHCALLGTRLQTIADFLTTHRILYSVPMTTFQVGKVLSILEKDPQYDFPGLFYIGLRLLLDRLFVRVFLFAGYLLLVL